MTPDNPRYYDPRFDDSCQIIPTAEMQPCSECGDDCAGYFEIDYFRVDGEIFCAGCYANLPVCGDGEHKFTGEPITVEGFSEVFCCDEHAKITEEW